MKTLPYLFVCLLYVVLLSQGCSKSSSSDDIQPSIYTFPLAGSVTGTSAQTFGVLVSSGLSSVTSMGICYSATNQSPTVADSKTTVSVDTLTFASKLSGLAPNTIYYYRTYVITGTATAYGSVAQFKTATATFALNTTVTTFAGIGTSGYVDGAGTIAQFGNPLGLCTDAAGNIYVADFYNNVIRKITPAGVTSTYAGSGTLGYQDGAAATAQFYGPQGVAIDAAGNVYVADMGNNMIRKISTAGMVTTLAGRGYTGYADGAGASAVFNLPAGVAVDAAGNVYVADRGNNMIRKITTAGVVSTLAGITTAGFVDGTGTAAQFASPGAIAVSSTGTVYIADLTNSAIRTITPTGAVSTLIGTTTLSTVLGAPWGIALDAAGNVYTTDGNGRVLKITTNNVIYPLAGVSATAGFVNGLNTAALFNSPRGIAIDASGNVFVSDYGNHAIRKLSIVTTP
ncbi:hypothetical protein KXQ82_01480 [Mucilaginibacter sp. HMF5004]|uniref:NHL repeat-containing protein n=1 Tax=Mucilaginibacter rivuli TaxID=2857527 RepID=UPI001C607D86|nr:NHL repeat-containing protein [Mucilaginibacter rivuli]MBW4888361.1 hypothetical protein [Mucilaginibacter rivuli]